MTNDKDNDAAFRAAVDDLNAVLREMCDCKRMDCTDNRKRVVELTRERSEAGRKLIDALRENRRLELEIARLMEQGRVTL